MRVLLDESLPRDLRSLIPGHEVETVQQRGWTGLKNGALLRSARESAFDVLVTADRNMQHRQNIAASGLALVVLQARSTRLPDLLPLLPKLLAKLPSIQAGEVTIVAA